MDNRQEELGSVDSQIDFIRSAGDLRAINNLLTRVMSERKIHALIKDENLNIICDVVLKLALDGDEKNRLFSAAVLGRLSAVVRKKERGEIISAALQNIFKTEPVSIEELADGEEKSYAASSLDDLDAPWIAEYCSSQLVLIDKSKNVRHTLTNKTLKATGDLTSFWRQTTQSLKKSNHLKSIEKDDMRYRRIRSISGAMSGAVKGWEGDVGEDPGKALAEWFSAALITSKKGVGHDVLVEILDDALEMLLRIIALRFSNALLAPTYDMLGKIRSTLGPDVWRVAMRDSKKIERVRTYLKETALVLARQGKTDDAFMDVLCTAYHSRAQVMPAIKAHFASAREINLDIKAWWEQGGVVSESQRKIEHPVGNSEDRQVGLLLINVSESRLVMERLASAAVSLLEMPDSSLAETVKKAIGSYTDIEAATMQLASMRKLKRMELKNIEMEYNPLQHDMLGGHQSGVRMVRVVRDGIQKDFGGKVKVLVKPRVVPSE